MHADRSPAKDLLTPSGRRAPRNLIYAVAACTGLGVVLWILLIGLAPYLKSIGSGWNRVVYAVFAPTCHQIDSRCLTVFGHPMAVCARCLGIYLGFLVGTILFPWCNRRQQALALPRVRTFVCLTIPIGVDTIGNLLTLWSTPHLLRLGLGWAWGMVLPFYFIPGLVDVLTRRA